MIDRDSSIEAKTLHDVEQLLNAGNIQVAVESIDDFLSFHNQSLWSIPMNNFSCFIHCCEVILWSAKDNSFDRIALQQVICYGLT